MASNKLVILILVLVAGSAAVLFALDQRETEPVVITNFEECANAGYPILETYPAQCKVGNRTFIQEVPTEQLPPAPVENGNVRLSTPLPDALVTSPLAVSGEARGTWFFEASFPVRLLDANGNELAVVPAQAQGEWMTENFVPFSTTLSFTAPETDAGFLVLEKDNPSGLPEFADEVRVKVRFRQ